MLFQRKILLVMLSTSLITLFTRYLIDYYKRSNHLRKRRQHLRITAVHKRHIDSVSFQKAFLDLKESLGKIGAFQDWQKVQGKS